MAEETTAFEFGQKVEILSGEFEGKIGFISGRGSVGYAVTFEVWRGRTGKAFISHQTDVRTGQLKAVE